MTINVEKIIKSIIMTTIFVLFAAMAGLVIFSDQITYFLKKHPDEYTEYSLLLGPGIGMAYAYLCWWMAERSKK